MAVFFYGFDVTRPPFDDVRVRRAFALATDVSSLSPGYAIIPPATGGFVPEGMPAHQPGIRLPYDLEGARRLLAEAGYPGSRGFPEIVGRLYPGGWGEWTRRIQQSQWVEGLGIKMRWVEVSQPELRARHHELRPHTFESWCPGDYPDPDIILRQRIPWDWIGWSNETYDRLVEEARHTFDQGQRIELYKQADRILIEEAVVVPTEYGGHPCLLQPWVTRFPAAPVYIRTWFWKDVVIEPH
jgi:ABC-type transport system substrate-binding protein